MQKLFILGMRLWGSMLTADFCTSRSAGDTLWCKGCCLHLTWVQVHVILICDIVVDYVMMMMMMMMMKKEDSCLLFIFQMWMKHDIFEQY